MSEAERHQNMIETSHIFGQHRDAWIYDVTYSLTEREDVPFWIDVAKQLRPNRILEIGTGSGRVAVSLAKAGFDVVGIDIEKAMLEIAEGKRDALTPKDKRRLDLVQADARNFAFNEKFDLIIIPLNTFNHFLTLEDQVAVLKCIKDHLNPEKGVLAMDLFNPSAKLAYTWNSREQGPINPDRQPLKEYFAVDKETSIGVFRAVYDYFDTATDTFYVEREGLVINMKDKTLIDGNRFKVPMALHGMLSLREPFSAAGFDSWQIIGNYQGYPSLDLLCLTSGMGIKGTPSEKMIVVTGPGYKRVKPKRISPEIAETLKTTY